MSQPMSSMVPPTSAWRSRRYQSGMAAAICISCSIWKSHKCRLMVAVPQGFDYEGVVPPRRTVGGDQSTVIRRANTLPARGARSSDDQAVGLDGTGTAGWPGGMRFIDLVSTGGTLKANNLVAVEHIYDVSSRLIVNQAAYKLKRELICRSSTLSAELSAQPS